MSVWLYRIKLRYLWEKYNPAKELQQVPEIGERIATELETVTNQRWFGKLFPKKFRKAATEREFNDVLGALYDFADTQRIWID